MIEDIEDELFALVVGFNRESPFPEGKFKTQMEELGYDLNEDASVEATEMPDGRDHSASIYEKECLEVTYIQEPGFLAIRIDVQEISSVESSIEKLVNMLSDKLKVDLDEDIERFQVSFEGNIWEGEPTTEYFVGKYEPDLSGIFDAKCNSFSFRLVSESDSDELPQYDVRIEPFARNNDYFYVKMTISHDNLEDSISFINSIENKLEQLIEAIKDE